MWALLWMMMLVLFINPNIMNFFSPYLMMENIPLAVLVMSTIVIFNILYFLYRRIVDLDNKLSLIIQKIAMDEYFNDDE